MSSAGSEVEEVKGFIMALSTLDGAHSLKWLIKGQDMTKSIVIIIPKKLY